MAEQLTTWRDGATRAAIVEFVERVTQGEREFARTAGAEAALQRAADEGWTIVSVNNDWSAVFAGDREAVAAAP